MSLRWFAVALIVFLVGLWAPGGSLPLDPWMTVQTSPLTRHPSDPV